MKQKPLVRLLLLVLVLAGLAITVTPFLFMLSTSFLHFAFTLPYPPHLIPDNPTLENFVRAWQLQNFGLAAYNTLCYAVGAVFGVLVLGSLTAYAFARFQFFGKEFLFALFIGSMMVPSLVPIIPTFLVMRNLHLLNSIPGMSLLFASLGIAGTTFMLRLFFQGLPRELEESVRVDGGGRWTVFWHIVLPLSKPALATVVIFNFIGAWEDYFWPLVLIQDEQKRVLSIVIQLIRNFHATNFSMLFAASLMAMIPEVLIFIFFQRYFVAGAITGAIKG